MELECHPLVIGVVTGCAARSSPPPPPLADRSPSEDVFGGEPSARLGGPDSQASCASCHSIGASNACVTSWMGGVALAESDPRWTALRARMETASDPSETTPNPLEPEVLGTTAIGHGRRRGHDARIDAVLRATRSLTRRAR